MRETELLHLILYAFSKGLAAHFGNAKSFFFNGFFLSIETPKQKHIECGRSLKVSSDSVRKPK